MQVIIIPTTKLFINKTDPTVEDVSTKENLMNAIGPAITGSIAVEEEEVLSSEAIQIDGKTYYRYELLTPFAEFGRALVIGPDTAQLNVYSALVQYAYNGVVYMLCT